jgi:hypothetical protein
MSYLEDDITTKHNMASIDETQCIVEEYLEKKIITEEDRISANEYIQQLDFYDKIALTLSIEILGSSFDLLKSNGYMEWFRSSKKKNE